MPVPTALPAIGSLALLAKQVVEGFIVGLHKSPFHGFSVEFAEHKIYNTGDALKNIDWKVYGRTDKLFTKKFEEETNLRCQIVIDNSSSMYYPILQKGSTQLNKIKFATVAAACFQYILKKQRDAVGLTIYNEKIVFNCDAKSSAVQHQLINNQLQFLLDDITPNKKSGTAAALHEIAERIHKRSLVVVLSDMLADDSATLFSALQHLKHNKHEVIVFDVADKNQELDFDFENRPYEFIDLETDEKIKLHPHQVKEHYMLQIQNQKKAIQLKCAQYHIDLVSVDINQSIEQILLPYLLKRERVK
jgi:uncharacterized protein (DUF58 family)